MPRRLVGREFWRAIVGKKENKSCEKEACSVLLSRCTTFGARSGICVQGGLEYFRLPKVDKPVSKTHGVWIMQSYFGCDSTVGIRTFNGIVLRKRLYLKRSVYGVMAGSTRLGRKQDETAGNDKEDTATWAVDLVKRRYHRCIVQKAPQQVRPNGRKPP